HHPPPRWPRLGRRGGQRWSDLLLCPPQKIERLQMKTHKWVLLVEDDANDADLVRQVLAKTRTDAEVVHVADGADALNCLYQRETFAIAEKGPPSLVLLDLKMSRVDGFAVLEQIKRDHGLKSIPVAVFTSSREEADIARSYHLGTNAYVVKP